jgi:hypothetical protein
MILKTQSKKNGYNNYHRKKALFSMSNAGAFSMFDRSRRGRTPSVLTSLPVYNALADK